ncbi:flippase [Pedobacter riviphilus]|uniref:Flippase n=1 Tax=Pedobacter riviphilus TaxID=2766984 RepID=A0ABX6TEI1_9SPHI|nr:flippase [Pedobacter riviphilus]QNR83909.1 flippase [Pedobacter riviphilus]
MKKNYIYNFLLTVFNIIFPILSFPYISRILGPGGVGKVQFVVTFAQYFALIAALGIPYYGVREIAKVRSDSDKLSKTFSELMVIYLTTSLGLSLIYISIVFAVARFSIDSSYYLTSSLVILLGFSSIDWFYQGLEEFKSIALRSILVKLISLALMFVFVKKADDALAYLYITIFSVLGNNFINILILRGKVSLTFSSLQLKRHFTPLLYIFGINLSAAMYNMLDTILLGLLSNDKAVGYYTASTKIARIAIPLVISMGIVLLPSITKSFQDKDGKHVALLKSSYNFIILLSIPITFGLFLLAPELINLVSGQAFEPAVKPMMILSVLPLLIGLGNLFGVQVLIAAGMEKQMLYAVMLGMFISIGLNVLMVPKMHEVGAAIVNSLTELIVSFMFIYYARKRYRLEFPIKIVGYAILSSLPFVPIIYLLRANMINVTYFLFSSVVVCGFVYFFLQYYLWRDIHTQNVVIKVKGIVMDVVKRFVKY